MGGREQTVALVVGGQALSHKAGFRRLHLYGMCDSRSAYHAHGSFRVLCGFLLSVKYHVIALRTCKPLHCEGSSYLRDMLTRAVPTRDLGSEATHNYLVVPLVRPSKFTCDEPVRSSEWQPPPPPPLDCGTPCRLSWDRLATNFKSQLKTHLLKLAFNMWLDFYLLHFIVKRSWTSLYRHVAPYML